MKSFFTVYWSCSLVLGLVFAPVAISESEELEICYYNPDAAIKSITDAVAAVQPFMSYINREVEWPQGSYFVWKHFARAKEFEEYVKKNKIEFAILNSFYFLNKQKEYNLVPFVVPLRDDDIYYYKVLIVHKDSPYQSVEDLKGKRLITTAAGSENYAFLNTLVFSNNFRIEQDFKLSIVDKSSEAMFSLLLNKAEAALVTKAAFEFMKELSPKTDKKLKILHTSQKINLTPMTYIKGNVSEEIIEKLATVCVTMAEKPRGAQSLLVFKVSGWRRGNMEDFSEMLKFLADQKPN
ncbi:phosphate/phosphite/phosphonate ABC transporter substrate-binding protein [candidate division CSSED10-310 bacterium]|uniref:Phosphate/phosphite/phosphonate ABC transporter substrate-binding protein n=1 Tax=candidate division CSSED10-310 bacterium TaxID=2855610 RepID=A0ABV6Z1M2_UNCC1